MLQLALTSGPQQPDADAMIGLEQAHRLNHSPGIRQLQVKRSLLEPHAVLADQTAQGGPTGRKGLALPAAALSPDQVSCRPVNPDHIAGGVDKQQTVTGKEQESGQAG